MDTWLNIVFGVGFALGVTEIFFLIRARRQVAPKINIPKKKYIWDGKKFNEIK
ncbi:hypothetical protein [Paenibacillus odorifer]|uniref:hypothetical protein n=1 Tax=Paenibacillus odorifer TaxID=189426 RepID=UPI0015BB3337|nr:hypothetical protein [Paenibacillus odorifer]